MRLLRPGFYPEVRRQETSPQPQRPTSARADHSFNPVRAD
jgi:hypothetical protein